MQNNGFNLEEWYEIVDANSDLPEFKSRFTMLDSTVNELNQNKDPSIKFQIPPQLDKNTFLNIARRVYFYYLFLLQKDIKAKIQETDQNASEIIDQLILKINERCERKRLELLRALGIHKNDDQLLRNVWLFAFYNYSRDPDLSPTLELLHILSKYISQKIEKKEYDEKLSSDPEKMSDSEIMNVFNLINKEMEAINNSS